MSPIPDEDPDELGPEDFTLGASDVMRKIKHWHDLAVEAEAELARLIGAGTPNTVVVAISAARAVLADHPAPLGNSVLHIAPYWQIRAERAQDAAARLRKTGSTGTPVSEPIDPP